MSAEQKPEEKVEQPAPEKAPAKGKKLSFEEFIEALRAATSSEDRRAAGQVYQLVRRGFAGEVTSERAQAVVELLRRWPDVDRLAVRLCAEQRTSRQSPFTRQVANALRLGFSMALGYPLRSAAAPDTSGAVLDWVDRAGGVRHAEDRPAGDDGGDGPNGAEGAPTDPERLLRMKFVCLLGEADEALLCEATYALLKQRLRGGKRGGAAPSPRDFIKLVGTLLAAPKVSAAAAANVLSAAAPASSVVAGLRERESDLSRRLQAARGRVAALEETEHSLREQLAESAREIARLTDQVAEKDASLVQWEERYQSLDDHWREVLRDRLARQGAELKGRIVHEVTEARLSLSGEPPDTGMAADRLARIERIIGDGGTDGG